MNREIKCRAWDKVNKKWVGRSFLEHLCVSGGVVVLVKYSANNRGGYDPKSVRQLTNDEVDNLEIVQYVGLKDKNGKEIYEGDLLKIPFNGSIREGVHQVFYYKDGFVTSSILFKDLETANKNSLTWMINRGAEVIGNIYENPELLKNV